MAALGKIIKQYGRQIHAFGVALFAFIESNPGCTYADIQKELDMGRSTVLDYCGRLEALGLISREARANDKGIPLPTRLNVANNTVQQADSSKHTRAQETPVITTVQHMDTVQQPDGIPLMDGAVGETDATKNPANNTVQQADSSKQYRPVTRRQNAPPITPCIDKNTLRSNQPSVGARAGARPPAEVVEHPSAKGESDHQRLMRELARRTGAIPDGKAQGDAVRWLLSHDYEPGECVACLDAFLAELKDPEHWRKSRVSWLTVKKEIGAWKLRGTGEATDETTAKQARQSYGKPEVTRDYSKFPARAG